MSYDRPGRHKPHGAYNEPRTVRALLSILWTLLQFLLVIAVLVAGFLAIRNFTESFDVERMAMNTACADRGPSCRGQFTRWERSAIVQTFDVYTPRGTVTVRCQREHYLVGDYRCTLRDMPAAIASEPAPEPQPSGPAPAKAVRK
jgi:hypothetical protein